MHDLLDLELVPALDGIYRRDAVQPAGLDDLAEAIAATEGLAMVGFS